MKNGDLYLVCFSLIFSGIYEIFMFNRKKKILTADEEDFSWAIFKLKVSSVHLVAVAILSVIRMLSNRMPSVMDQSSKPTAPWNINSQIYFVAQRLQIQAGMTM